jgi:hypothetical protein
MIDWHFKKNKLVNGMEMSSESKQQKKKKRRKERERKIPSTGIGNRGKKNVQEK